MSHLKTFHGERSESAADLHAKDVSVSAAVVLLHLFHWVSSRSHLSLVVSCAATSRDLLCGTATRPGPASRQERGKADRWCFNGGAEDVGSAAAATVGLPVVRQSERNIFPLGLQPALPGLHPAAPTLFSCRRPKCGMSKPAAQVCHSPNRLSQMHPKPKQVPGLWKQRRREIREVEEQAGAPGG